MASQALASLTATYTDSEGEEDMEDGQQTPDKDEQKVTHSLPGSPRHASVSGAPASAPASPRVQRLVSYVDDTVVSDDEETSPDPEQQDDMRRLSMEVDTDEIVRSDNDDGDETVIIPPEPPGKCPKELQEKITKSYQRMLTEGLDMNKIIQDRKNFRNPSIYEKLIQYCDINELDTNYPPEIYDPLRWGKESYFDELARVQKVEMDRREKDKKEKLSKLDFMTGSISKKSESDDEKKRKSKWDQAAPNTSSSKPSVKQPGLLPLTSNVTGTKSTVISAFGSLPKKPKV